MLCTWQSCDHNWGKQPSRPWVAPLPYLQRKTSSTTQAPRQGEWQSLCVSEIFRVDPASSQEQISVL